MGTDQLSCSEISHTSDGRIWEVSQRQANVRLDDRLFEQIEVAAFVHRRSFAEEMRAALVAWAERHEDNPQIQKAGSARDPLAEEADEAGNVTALNPGDRRRKRSG
jgi:plasmid stability protein